jgi:hypothetical protein
MFYLDKKVLEVTFPVENPVEGLNSILEVVADCPMLIDPVPDKPV